MTRKIVDYNSQDSPYGLDEQCGVGNSSDLVDTLRTLNIEIISCKADNDRFV